MTQSHLVQSKYLESERIERNFEDELEAKIFNWLDQ
jgi:hypothetical protein